MYNIAICEDNEEQQKIIENYIIMNMKISDFRIDKYDTGESLVAAFINDERYIIIFLDMQMNELDGIQTAELIRKYDEECIIIIITSIIEYAVEGYHIDAFDFILKPVTEQKFNLIMNKALKKLKAKVKKTYVIQTRGKTKIIKLSDIKYIESDKRSVHIHCQEESLNSNENIGKVETKLEEEDFIRISRYYIVNMDYISEIGSKCITLKSGESLKFSDKYRDIIKKNYMKYMMGDF